MMELRKEITGDQAKNLKQAGLGITLVLLGIAAVLMFWPQTVDPPENYANATSDTVHESREDASKMFEITSLGVSPASHKIEVGEAVGFQNRLDKKVEINFDRSKDTLKLGQGESGSVYINGITYFTVSGPEYSSSGRVNVQ